MSIKNRSLIQVNQDLDLMQKKVKQLNTQLSTQQQRNNVMHHRIKEIQRINPNRDKSPLQQLQEHLNMDRQFVQEIFKPMKGNEYLYMRNQRIKTEQDLMQSRQFEIQQKRNKVIEIDNQEQLIPIKRAEFAQKKILQAKLMENLFIERTQHLASLKKKEISKLQQQEEVISTQLFRYFCQYISAKKEEEILQAKLQRVMHTPQIMTSFLPTLDKYSNPSRQSGLSSCQKSPQKSASTKNHLTRDRGLSQNSRYPTTQQLFDDSDYEPRHKSKSITTHQQACQTSFLTKIESVQYSMNFDSYQSEHRQPTEKSMTSQIPEEIERSFGLWNTSRFQIGNLYTWGRHSLGCGLAQESQSDQLRPRKIDFFKNNVHKVVAGEATTAVITDNGDLYMFGANEHGQLGIGNKEDHHTPVQVSFFREMGLTVQDIALGQGHAAALASDGNVYTWGRANKYPLIQSAGGLGDNYDSDLLVPTAVPQLKGLPKPEFVSAGIDFTLVINTNQEVYGWGNGKGGKLGNGDIDPLVYPERNQVFDKLKHAGYKVTKIRTANTGTVALLNDGTLIGFGVNNFGQLGVREQEYVRTDIENEIPLPINDKYLDKNEKVIDFDLGFNMLIFYTNLNRVFISGADICYVPKPVPQIPLSEKVIRVSASDNCFAVQTDKNFYVSNQYVQPYEERDQKLVFKTQQEKLFEGKLVDFGGSYGVRYAVVQN